MDISMEPSHSTSLAEVRFHTRGATRSRGLEPLPPGPPFPMNYSVAKRDNNALFVANKYFGHDAIASVRTKYHRSSLNFDDLRDNLMDFDIRRASRSHSDAYYMIVESVRQDLGLAGANLIPLTFGAVANASEVPNQKFPLKA